MLFRTICTIVILLSTQSSAQDFGNWSEIDSMNIARAGHGIAELPNGDILVAGYINFTPKVNSEIFRRGSGKWEMIEPMKKPMVGPKLITLATGDVFAFAGFDDLACQIFNPQTSTWRMTDSMYFARLFGVNYVVLPDGKIMVIGGFDIDDSTYDAIYYDKCEIFDPVTEKWELAAPLNVGRSSHDAVLLDNNRILVSGGDTDDGVTFSCEIYNILENTWIMTAPMNQMRYYHRSCLLDNGSVLVMGGQDYHNPDRSVENSCEIFFPGSEKWEFARPMHSRRLYHIIYRLGNDNIIIIGDYNYELYSLSEMKSIFTGKFPATMEAEYNSIQLKNGSILVAGGYENILDASMPIKLPTNKCFIYDLTTLVNDKVFLEAEYKLHPNYPNPFNPKTTISYSLPENAYVKLKVFNTLGSEVAELINSYKTSGTHTVIFDGSSLASGIYILNLTAGEFGKSRKILLMK